MKVLQINVVFRKGSTGKIVNDIHRNLIRKDIESVICYGRGEKVSDKNIHKTSKEFLSKINALKSRITGIQFNGSFIATKRLIKIIIQENPDIVHLHCINGYFVNIYKLLDFLKISKIKTVLTMHAEFMYTGNCGYSYDCIKWNETQGCNRCPILKEATKSLFFDRTNFNWNKMYLSFKDFYNLKIVSVSPWLMNRAKTSKILENKKHFVILNGIDTDNIFKVYDCMNLKKELNIKNEKILLHVTSNFTNEIKGGKYIIKLARRLVNEDLKIIVIGNSNKCLKLPENIIDIGIIKNQKKLAEYYSMADATILTSKRESFSMICAESIASGTPVLGFKAGAPEQIAISDYSEFVKYGDIDKLESIIYKWLKLDKMKIYKDEFSRFYSSSKMVDEYVRLYENF